MQTMIKVFMWIRSLEIDLNCWKISRVWLFIEPQMMRKLCTRWHNLGDFMDRTKHVMQLPLTVTFLNNVSWLKCLHVWQTRVVDRRSAVGSCFKISIVISTGILGILTQSLQWASEGRISHTWFCLSSLIQPLSAKATCRCPLNKWQTTCQMHTLCYAHKHLEK